jgi:hypothetical protein
MQKKLFFPIPRILRQLGRKHVNKDQEDLRFFSIRDRLFINILSGKQ